MWLIKNLFKSVYTSTHPRHNLILYHSCKCLKFLQVEVLQAWNNSLILMLPAPADLMACVSGRCLPVGTMACVFSSFLKSWHCLPADPMACVCRSFLKQNNVLLRRSFVLVVAKQLVCLCAQLRPYCPIYHYHNLPSSSFPIVSIYLSLSITYYCYTALLIPRNASHFITVEV